MARGGFPGMGGNMQQLMRQAQKMQQDVQRLQQEISEREFSAAAGGGVVKATVLGREVVKAIECEPACVGPDGVEVLRELVLAAVDEALRMADETMASEMNRVTGGMNLGF